MKNKSLVISEMYWRLFPPQYLSLITTYFCNIINGFVVGNFLSNEAMAALGFVSPFTVLISFISAISASGSKIICGKLIGRNNLDKLKNVFTNSILIMLVLGVVLFGFVNLQTSTIASLLGANADTAGYVVQYLRGLSIGIIPMLLVPLLTAYLQITNENGITLIGAGILGVANLIFSLLSVNVFNSGIFGIGVSTSLAQLVSCLFLIIFILIKKKLLRFDVKLTNFSEISEIFILGSPSALANVFYSIRNIIYNSRVNLIAGTNGVSSLALLNTSAGIFDAFNIVHGAIVLMLACIFVGEKDKVQLKNLFRITSIYGIIMGMAKIVIIIIFGKQMLVLFGAKGEVLDMAYELYVYYSLSMPLNMITVEIISMHHSLERVNYANIIYFVNALVVPMICCFALDKIFGVYAIWISYALAELISIIILYAVPCIKRKKIVTSFDELIGFNSNFKLDNKMSLVVKNIDEVVLVSKQVEEFCKKNNVEPSKSMMCALCLEEMAGNVVEHGFTKGKRTNYSIEIFVACEKDELLLRIRDDAPSFDPHTKLATQNPDDPCKNMGIRLVNKIAKEMNYQSYFGMNVLTINL